VTIDFDLSGAIDVAAERARLAKDLAAAQKERDVNAAKLARGVHREGARAVVAKHRGR